MHIMSRTLTNGTASMNIMIRTLRLGRLGSHPRNFAAGPSGLRPRHLREAQAPGLRDEVLRHLALVVHIWARGEAPLEAPTMALRHTARGNPQAGR